MEKWTIRMPTKYYTGFGDNKETSIGNFKALKSSLIFHAVGDIDELNSKIGELIAKIKESKKEYNLKIGPGNSEVGLQDALIEIQSELFSMGAEIASLANKAFEPKKRISKADVSRLEAYADSMSKRFPPLKNFVLPGGCPESAIADSARAVARRAERSIVALADSIKIENTEILAYINRLSSVLFVVARFLNHENGVDEIPPHY